MEWVTTSLLLEELRGFDNEVAWNRLHECVRPPLIAFARRMGFSTGEADDVAQKTLIAFASAYRDGKYDRERGGLKDWIFGISYRQIQRARRKEARLARSDGDSFPMHQLPGREQATRSWDEEWAKSVLHSCLRRVRTEVEPDTYRAFELVVFAKTKAADVAAQLGIRATPSS